MQTYPSIGDVNIADSVEPRRYSRPMFKRDSCFDRSIQWEIMSQTNIRNDATASGIRLFYAFET